MIKTLTAACVAALLSTAAHAEIRIDESYARSSGAMAKAGAAFLMIKNTGPEDDRLIGVTSPASVRVELHTHIEKDGIMNMVEVEDGIPIPAGGMAMLQRGGDHLMFMGLKAPWAQGDMIPVTLTFEKAGEMALEIPVDLERKATHSGHNDHSGDHAGHNMDHSN